jgi:hypothetical protein
VSKASVLKRSTIRAERRWEVIRERIFLCNEGRERRMVIDMSGPGFISGGRSERVTGGRKMWEMLDGREVRTLVCAFEGGLSVGMMKMMGRLWRMVSRLANSIIGMRCPIPGVGNMATRGGSSSCFRVVTDCWCSILLKIELMIIMSEWYLNLCLCFGWRNSTLLF